MVFMVARGADPGAIRFAMDGADKLDTSPEGDLLVAIGGGELRFHKPVAKVTLITLENWPRNDCGRRFAKQN
jgi:hypothetical protein